MAFTQYFTDNFDRANTVPSANPGSVGNGWVDRDGSNWRIDANQLHGQNVATYGTDHLERPDSESYRNVRLVCRWTYSGNNFLFAPRYDHTSRNSYLIGNNGGTAGNMWTQVGGSTTPLTPTVVLSLSLTTGRVYRIECDITGDGTTTSIDLKYFDETTNGVGTTTLAGHFTETDTHTSLQAANAVALSGTGAWYADDITLYQDDGVAASAAVTPDPVTTNTTTAMTATGTGTAWTGTTTVTVDVGTIPSASIVRVDADTITFDYSAPAAAGTATFTITEGAQALTDAVTVSAPAGLTAGTLSKGTQTGTSIAVDGTAATGGTTPYTYAWYRAEYPGFTMDAGTLLTGQTGEDLADTTIAFGRIYFYRRRVTDSAATPATADTAELVVGTIRSALQIGIVGDSQMRDYLGAGTGAIPFAEAVLEQAWGERAVTFVNQAVSGSTSADWDNTADVNYTNAIAGFVNAATTPYVIVMLGANDSNVPVAAATYLTNMTNLVNNLVAAGYVVILCYTPYITHVDWTTADRAMLQSYRAQLDTLINGTTVLRGERDVAWPYAANNAATLYGDGVHFSMGGAPIYGRMLARAIMEAIGGHGQGGVTGTILVPDTVSPASVTAGVADTTVTVTRTAADLTNRCVVHYNGAARATTYVDASTLTAVIPATDLDTAGGAQIVIVKP